MKKIFFKALNFNSNETYGTSILTANSFFDRLLGLMFKHEMKMPDGSIFDGLIIEQCNSIHTCFMKFSIDAIFLDNKNRVVKYHKNLKPWRITPIYLKANKVLELKSGTIKDPIQIGDRIEIICIN
ncbi:MAG: DUF192 domain-containing protein [Oligoflexia bacterium]|nr:DUF192 domain-containing protein [Oligoflexia bacterium]MBF0364367.1 DUF192 domain-containing protein [Oligoflexia bacterium]